MTGAFQMMAYFVGSTHGSIHAGLPSWIDLRLDVETPEGARKIAAQFPKSAGVKAGICHDWRADKVTGWVNLKINLAPDGANKGINETGIKRYRSFVRAAARLGYEIEYLAPSERQVNSYPTREDFEAAIS